MKEKTDFAELKKKTAKVLSKFHKCLKAFKRYTYKDSFFTNETIGSMRKKREKRL